MAEVVKVDAGQPNSASALHEQAYATVEVLATEQAIANSIERLAVTPGPDLPQSDVEAAVVAKEAEVTSVEEDIERDELAALRQRVASVLDDRTPGAAPVEHDMPHAHPETGHEGLGL